MFKIISVNDIKISVSAGTAMALAAGVSIYSAATIKDTSLSIYFLPIAVIFIGATIFIEGIHLLMNNTVERLKIDEKQKIEPNILDAN